MDILAKYAKAIVAILVLVVAGIASALGVETGINVEEWWHVLGVALLGGVAVWGVPNKEKE